MNQWTIAVAALLCVSVPQVLIGQQTPPPLGTDQLTPINRAPLTPGELRSAELVNEVNAAIAARKAQDELVAARILGLVFAAGDSELFRAAQQSYADAVWAAGLRYAQHDSDPAAEQGLEQLLARNAALLAENKIPAEVISAGRIYLAQFQFNTHQHAKAQKTLDSVAAAMADDRVWAGFRGMYWNLRGLLATLESNFALAIDCHSKASELRRGDKLLVDEAESLNNLGFLYLRLGDYTAARQVLEHAKALYAAIRAVTRESMTDGELYAALNLAKTYEGARDYATSASELESLLPVVRRMPLELDCYCRNNLAIAYYGQGKFARCEEILNECRPLAVRAFGEGHPHLAELDVNLGWVALATQRPEVAEKKFQAALASLKAVDPNHYRIPEIMGYLGRAFSSLGKSAEAREMLEQALDRREQYLARTLGSALSERDRLAFVQQLRVHPESLAWPGILDTYLELAPVLEIPVNQQYSRVLAWKGALGRDRRQELKEEESAESRAVEAQRADIRRRLQALTARQRTGDPDAPSQIVALERQANELERQARRLRQATTTAQPPTTIAAIAAALPAGASLVDVIEVRRYRPRKEGQAVRDDRMYEAFIVAAKGDVERFEVGASVLVDSLVSQLVDAITVQQNPEVPAQRLHGLFGQRLREQVGPLPLLIISADGSLNRLPWCALPGLEKQYWVEELAVATVASAQSLVARRGAKSDAVQSAPAQLGVAQPQWLTVGAVDYGLAAEGVKPVDDLPKTGEEARKVDQLFVSYFAGQAQRNQERDRVLSGKEATKEKLLKLLPKTHFVHIATHGSFRNRRRDAFEIADATSSLDSALVLAGANADQTGGAESLLTAEELSSLDLSHIDLMVLSACETGLGHIQAGQGLVGLLGALDRAQVKTVVASLWKVEDQATAALMQRFYKHLLAHQKEMKIAESIRQAQLETLRAPDGSTAHPYYWAAWTVMGNPENRRN